MFGIRKYTDEVLVRDIREGGRSADRAVAHLIDKEFGRIKHLILQRNGSDADAEDVFMEGVTALIMNIRKDKFQGQSAIGTYLFAICKGIWYKRFQKRMRETQVKDQLVVVEEDHHTPELSLLGEEQQQLLTQLFDRLRDKCREVLFLWASGYAMQEIAGQLAYSSAQVAMNKKNKCLKELHGMLEKNESVQALVRELYVA